MNYVSEKHHKGYKIRICMAVEPGISVRLLATNIDILRGKLNEE
jgi:hypothetical protein